MAEILSNIASVSYVLAVVFLIAAVVFWFWFGIPGIIGDLSGRTARKSIAKIREKNEKSGKKTYRPSAVNRNRGKLTQKMRESGALPVSNNQTGYGMRGKTETEATALLSQTVFTEADYDTKSASTALLSAVEPVSPEGIREGCETAPLSGQSFTQRRGLGTVEIQDMIHAGGWSMLENIRFVHTEEMID